MNQIEKSDKIASEQAYEQKQRRPSVGLTVSNVFIIKKVCSWFTVTLGICMYVI